MKEFFNCELKYYKYLILGLFIVSLIIFILNIIIPIPKYIPNIYIINILLIIINIILSTIKFFFLLFSKNKIDKCSDLSLMRKASGWLAIG